MRPAKIFAFLIILISAGMIFFFSQKKGTLEEDLDKFVVKDTAKITKIIISEDENKIILTRNKTNWKINDNYTARPDAIYTILKIFNQLQIKSTVPTSELDSIKQTLKKQALTIEIIGEIFGDKKFKISKLDNNLATYFWAEKTENPILLNVPGMEKNLSVYFNSNPNFWKSKIVFDYLPNEIKSIEVIFPNETENSFSIINEKQLELIDFQKNKIIKSNLENIKNYMVLFRKIEYKKLMKSNEIDKNWFDEKNIYAIFSITNSENSKNTVKFYYKKTENNKNDVNDLYAIQNDEIFFEITYFSIDPILKEKNYFLKQ